MEVKWWKLYYCEMLYAYWTSCNLSWAKFWIVDSKLLTKNDLAIDKKTKKNATETGNCETKRYYIIQIIRSFVTLSIINFLLRVTRNIFLCYYTIWSCQKIHISRYRTSKRGKNDKGRQLSQAHTSNFNIFYFPIFKDDIYLDR